MIGIVCGGGKYPRLVIESCIKKGFDICLLIIGRTDRFDNYSKLPKLCVNFGKIGLALEFFKLNRVDKIVFAGHVKRPKLSELDLDRVGINWLLKLWYPMIFKGDNALLSAVSCLFAQENIQVVSGTNFLDDVLLKEGTYSDIELSKKERNDIILGIREAQSLGLQDIGQGVVISDGRIIAREDKWGTDALISRCYEGILVKTSKPQQDFRLDLPTIGVDTIENLHRHGFKGLVIEAGKTIVIDKEAVVQKAKEYRLFFQAILLSKKRRIFIMAGEASGDYLGARLMRSIKRLDNDVEFIGIGGHCMDRAGLIRLFSISELSIIGIWEIIGKIFSMKKCIKRTADTILRYQPDVVIGIDSSGFNFRVYKILKKNKFMSSIIHYVAPPVWAWRKWRAKSLHKFIDKLMVLLPFEKEIFSKYQLPTVFVGHTIAMDRDFLPVSEKKDQRYVTVTLLPGSRPSEIEKHMPILREFTELMAKKYSNVRFMLPTITEIAPLIKKHVDNWKIKPTVSTKKMKKVKAYNMSDVAVAASGTVTLELAKMQVPFVVIYKTSFVSYFLVKKLIQIPYVCLVNILSGRALVKELLQRECTAKNIFDEVTDLLFSGKAQTQREEFKKIMNQLAAEPDCAAKEVVETINNATC
ncbi:MAG: lipid-A-disaccharide synthase [Alphaproteobacteria bacterium]|nr:lipid-A-disaccharide synthase [Alphaproteobacteria bacterium]